MHSMHRPTLMLSALLVSALLAGCSDDNKADPNDSAHQTGSRYRQPTETIDAEEVEELVRQIRQASGDQRSELFKKLVDLGPVAAPGLIEVIRKHAARPGVEGWKMRVTAMRALKACDDRALPALLAASRDPNEVVRWTVLSALAGTEPRDNPALDRLIEALHNDPSPVCRRTAATGIGSFGPRGAVAVDHLLAAIDADPNGMSYPVLRSLKEIGPAAEAAVPAVVDLVEDLRTGQLQSMAMEFLGRCADVSEVARDAALEAMGHQSIHYYAGASRGLAEIEEPSNGLLSALAQRIETGSPELRQHSVYPLKAWAQGSSRAMGLLAGLLGDRAACGEAGRALGELGEPAVAPILQVMRNDPDVAKYPACYQALQKIGKPMEAPVRGLLRDGQAPIKVRTAAARALMKLEKPKAETVSTAARLIDHVDLGLARACLKALASFGPASQPATDRLVATMRRLAAEADAGGMIGNRGKLCAVALGSIGKSERKHVLTMIASEDGRLAEYGGIAASQWPELDEETVSSLVDAVKRFRNPRRQLVTALGKADKHGDKAVGVLLEKMDTIGLKQAVIMTLGEIGPAAANAAPVLVDELTNETVHASYAATALGRIGVVNDDVLPALIDALSSESGFVRTQAARALREIGKDARPAIPALVKALEDDNYWVVDGALGVLAKTVRPDDAEVAAPAVLKLVRAGKRGTRARKAAEILPLFGKANSPYADDLIAIAEDSKQNLNIRHQAVKALAGLGADHAQAVACLKRIADSKAPTISRMAVEALKNLSTSD